MTSLGGGGGGQFLQISTYIRAAILRGSERRSYTANAILRAHFKGHMHLASIFYYAESS